MVTRILGVMVLCASLAAGGSRAEPFYARGDFHAGSGDLWSYDDGNRLYDDGLHDDGAANDGVHGGWVISDQPGVFREFKIGTADWSQAYPTNPVYPLANAVLYQPDAGEIIHFRLDTNGVGDGWQPMANAVACDHFSMPGLQFEVIGSAPELGEWQSGVPAVFDGDVWRVKLAIATPGIYGFKFRIVGTGDICNLGVHYNMFLGDNFVFETTKPDALTLFEFNPTGGRGRAVETGATPVETSTWGRLKALMR